MSNPSFPLLDDPQPNTYPLSIIAKVVLVPLNIDFTILSLSSIEIYGINRFENAPFPNLPFNPDPHKYTS